MKKKYINSIFDIIFAPELFLIDYIMKNQDNGNAQLNSVRNEFNDRIVTKSYLGRTKRVAWTSVRRFRSI